MKKILFIESSPRKDNSMTTSTCMKLIEEIGKYVEVEVDMLDLWQTPLPHMNGATLDAKYAIFSGQSLSADEKQSWASIEAHVERFDAADMVIIAAPTWNWGVPYVLKHYVDVITQPLLTFTWTPEEGYTPVLAERDAILVTSSGGDYTQGSGNENEDFAIKYSQLWLTSCMGCRLETISLTMTAAGEEAIKETVVSAEKKIEDLCVRYFPR